MNTNTEMEGNTITMPAAAVKSIKTWISVWALLIFAGMGLLAWNAREQRGANCDLTEQALDAYTEGLVLAVTGDGPVGPEREAEIDAAINRLRATYQPFFAECG